MNMEPLKRLVHTYSQLDNAQTTASTRGREDGIVHEVGMVSIFSRLPISLEYFHNIVVLVQWCLEIFEFMLTRVGFLD